MLDASYLDELRIKERGKYFQRVLSFLDIDLHSGIRRGFSGWEVEE